MNTHELKTFRMVEAIKFLEVFNEASTVMQQSKRPTLHLCYLYYYSLERHCAENHDDVYIIKILKKKSLEVLKQKWFPQLKIQHKAATFLFPATKKLAIFSEGEKEEVYSYISELYTKIGDHNALHVSNAIETRPNTLYDIFRGNDNNLNEQYLWYFFFYS